MTLFKKKNQMSMYWMKQVCFLHGYVCVCCAFFPFSQSQCHKPSRRDRMNAKQHVDVWTYKKSKSMSRYWMKQVCVCVCVCVYTTPRRITDFDSEDPQHPPPNGGFVHKALRYMQSLMPTNQRRMGRKAFCHQQRKSFLSFFCVCIPFFSDDKENVTNLLSIF